MLLMFVSSLYPSAMYNLVELGGELLGEFRIVREAHQFLERFAEAAQLDVQVRIDEQRAELVIGSYRMEIDQIGDVDPLVAVVHAAQVGLAHVFQLIQVEIIAPQFRTVHFPAENVVIFFVDQTLDLDFALVDLQ